jgi:hypothetical protein
MADESDEPGWLPYRACIGGLTTLVRMLWEDKDMYERRCRELVRLNDEANAEIESLRKKLRDKKPSLTRPH